MGLQMYALQVDAEKGVVFRNGKQVGGRSGDYLRFNFEKQKFPAHRFIYMHVHGPVPRTSEIDHINGNKLDNRIENLRRVSTSQNQQNRRGPQKNSTTKVRGVFWHVGKRKYMAKLKINGKQIYAGYFDDIEKAKLAYAKTAAVYHTHNPLAAKE
jgi:hypothetical protein